MDEQSPYERMAATRAEQDREYKETLAEATGDPYAVLKISDRRYRVIKRTSVGRTNIDSVMVPIARWGFASDPLNWNDVHLELARLREWVPDKQKFANLHPDGVCRHDGTKHDDHGNVVCPLMVKNG